MCEIRLVYFVVVVTEFWRQKKMLWLCVYLLIFAMGEAASNEQRQRRHQKHWPAQNLIADFEVAVKRPPIQQQRHPQLFVAYVIENDDMLVKKVCQCTAKKIIVHFLAGQKNDIVKLSRYK